MRKLKSKKFPIIRIFSWSTGHGDHFEGFTINFHHKIGSNEEFKKYALLVRPTSIFHNFKNYIERG